MLQTKERTNRKINKQADRHIDTNKYFTFEKDNKWMQYSFFWLQHNSKFRLLPIMECISYVCLIYGIENNIIIAYLLHFKIYHI